MDTASPSTNAFQSSAFTRYFLSRVGHHFAMQIMTTAITWQVWDITRDAKNLAYIGLAVFIPVLLLVIPAGLAADRFDRKLILAICMGFEAVAGLGLLAFAMGAHAQVWPVFGWLALIGTAAAFGNPAASSLVPNMLSPAALAHGISVNTMSWQAASILGPAFGGVLLLWGSSFTYMVAVALSLMACLAVTFMGHVAQTHHENPDTGLLAVIGGFQFILREPIVLGAISLDMFAVLLGGAVAIMPIYASDILHLGAVGNGLLRAAPGVGAIAVGLWLAKFGIKDKAGWWLFISVAFSGAVILVFGFSTIAWLSILMLVLYGAFDMISVYVREILMQLWIPDRLRGRVNAVNNVFIGASNQLGEARAGFSAAWLGAVPAVVIGGAGTVAVAALWAYMFPKLREARKLTVAD
jgi:MFS family permease